MSAGEALYKRAKIGELNCLEEETDVRESLQSQFSFFQCDGKEESRDIPEGFLGNLLSWRKEGCLLPRAQSKQLPLAPGSSLLFKAWVRELHKPWAFRAEGHSTENEEELQNFTPKACQGRTSCLYTVYAKTTLKPHLEKQQSTIFHSLYYKQE